jgi:hypothetical protein
MNLRPLLGLATLFVGLCASGGAQGQDEKQAPPAPPRAAVPISFLPPPLENATYSLGIYETRSGKLVRRLHEIAPESAFAVGLNGLITKWDGKDDNGQLAPPGRYAARGYAVGALKVEGQSILGNDWTAEDDTLRVRHVESICLLLNDGGLAVLATMADDSLALLRLAAADGKLLWRSRVSKCTKPFLVFEGDKIVVWEPVGQSSDVVAGYLLSDGSETVVTVSATAAADPRESFGKDHTLWEIADDSSLIQKGTDGSVLRRLEVKPGEPIPQAVSASLTQDRLYLLEEVGSWQRVRGLSWIATKEENGKQVSTWQTFFERNIRAPDPALGLESPSVPIEINLVENPLEPGKPQKVKLAAGFDGKGSYLTTADGLRLRQISQRANLKAVKLTKGKTGNSLTFFQTDGAAWDEFSIEGARNMMAFDAGEFEMTATGEKPVTEKAPEPPDL